MPRRTLAFLVFLLLVPFAGQAGEPPAVYSKRFAAGFETTYRNVHEALEDARFWVISEARISDNLARFAERWGEDYNRNGLDVIRSLSVCNPWYTNQIANHDPAMLALCPLSVTIYTRGEASHVLFARPSAHAGESPALDVLREVEDKIITAIEGAFEE